MFIQFDGNNYNQSIKSHFKMRLHFLTKILLLFYLLSLSSLISADTLQGQVVGVAVLSLIAQTLKPKFD